MHLKKIILMLLLIGLWTKLSAQKTPASSWSIESNVHFGEIKRIKRVEHFLERGPFRIYSLRIGYTETSADSTGYACSYNYPTLGIGASIADFLDVKLKDQYPGTTSYLDNIYTVYGFIEKPFLRYKEVSLNYTIEAGLSYAPGPYDPYKNPCNEFVSSSIMVYVGAGVGMRYKLLNQIELGINTGVKHYSNGRMGMPNTGINTVGTDVGLRYYFSPTCLEYKKAELPAFKSHYYAHFSIAGGMQTSVEEWEIYAAGITDPAQRKKYFKRSPKLSINSDIMYRINRRYGVGIGLDLFCTPGVKKHREWDKLIYGEEHRAGVTYNPFSVGIAINQEVHYKNMSLYANVGYYLYHELGIRQKESPLYQRAGFRYNFPSLHNLYIGYGIKAHKFSVAEYLELTIGKKLETSLTGALVLGQ